MIAIQYRRALQLSALFVWALLYSVSTFAETTRVTYVFDGDSVRVADGREIRFIGINAPELGKNGGPDEPLARDARAAVTRLIGNGEIRLEYDVERKDRYGRTLAYVFLPDGRSVEMELLREGLAFLVAQSPNIARLSQFETAQTEARRANLGIWNHPYYKPRDAATLTMTDTGFHVVEGRIQRVGRGPRAVYLDLSNRFTIVIPRENWHFFGGNPQRFRNQHVIVRGWISPHDDRLRLRLSHPVMLEMVN